MEYILDTNVYRELVYGRKLSEVPSIAKIIIDWENKTNSHSGLSIVVSMELIQHLTDNDPAKQECYKALCLQVLHTKRLVITKQVEEGIFYPPLNEIITKFLFNRNSKFSHLYLNVLDLALCITENQDISKCIIHAKYIQIIKEQVVFEKMEIKTNIEKYLKSINSNILDWEHLPKNKNKSKAFFKNLANGVYMNQLGYSLVKRAYDIAEVKLKSEGLETEIQNFVRVFEAALQMNNLLLAKVGNGVKKLANVNDPRWNTINDVQIMFGLLIKSENKILVTGENDIIKSCHKCSLNNKVLNSKDYFQSLGI